MSSRILYRARKSFLLRDKQDLISISNQALVPLFSELQTSLSTLSHSVNHSFNMICTSVTSFRVRESHSVRCLVLI